MNAAEYKARQTRKVTTPDGLEVTLRKPVALRLLNNFDLQPAAMAMARRLAAEGKDEAEIKAAIIGAGERDLHAFVCCLVCDCAVEPRLVLNEAEAVQDDQLWIYALSDIDQAFLQEAVVYWADLETPGDVATAARFPEQDGGERDSSGAGCDPGADSPDIP